METFKCQAACDVTLTQADGHRLIRIVGNGPAAEGIIEVPAINAAIRAREYAVARKQANPHQAETQAHPQPGDTPADDGVVELHQCI